MTMPRPTSHGFRQRGVAMIEFAILVPLLLLILFGITEFSRALFEFDTLDKATRDACRYLSTQAPGDAAAQGVAVCLATYGNQSCTGSPLVPGLTTAMVKVCDSVDATQCPGDPSYTIGGIHLVSVKIEGYTFNSAVSFDLMGLSIGLPTFTFRTVGTVMRQI